MNVLITPKQTQLIAASVSLGFLLIHVAMFLVFRSCGVTPMAIFNVGSMLFYLLSLLLIRRKAFRTFVVLVYAEVVLHMSMAIVNVGWGAGFQIPLIGMSILAFFAEYLSRSMGYEYVPGLALSITGMCGYLYSYEFIAYHPVPYVLPDDVTFWLNLAWGVIVFSITVFFLQVFVIVTFESEKLMSVELAHDKLTGLPNRYHMAEYLKRAEEEGGLAGYWLAMADIDDFKNVNDTYGHNCGDYVLKTLAEIMTGDTADTELCRWGGEEFLMVGKIKSSMADQCARLDRLRKTIADYGFWYDENRLNLTITIGMCPYSEGISITEWINLADQKLYEGKCNGKNQLVA